MKQIILNQPNVHYTMRKMLFLKPVLVEKAQPGGFILLRPSGFIFHFIILKHSQRIPEYQEVTFPSLLWCFCELGVLSVYYNCHNHRILFFITCSMYLYYCNLCSLSCYYANSVCPLSVKFKSSFSVHPDAASLEHLELLTL